MSFKSDIADFKRKAEKAALMVFRGTAIEIFSKVIKRTPVKTGRLRGNWQTALNIIPKGAVVRTSAQALSSVNRGTSRAKLTDTIYLINNLPYADAIENGRSKQAPSGMVKVTVAEFKRIVASRASKV